MSTDNLTNKASPPRLAAAAALLLSLALSACGWLSPSAAPEPTRPAEPPTPPTRPVWSARADLRVGDSIVARPFTRLEVLAADTLGLRVRCGVCAGAPEGIVAETEVLVRPLPPEVAAWGTLAEFAFSIREAAARRDLDALQPAMVDDFSYSFVGVQSPEVALEVWRSEDFATLDQIPALLDLGLSTTDGRIWSAPPAFTDGFGYRGLRVGFRQRSDGRWEWVYAIRGIVDDGARE